MELCLPYTIRIWAQEKNADHTRTRTKLQGDQHIEWYNIPIAAKAKIELVRGTQNKLNTLASIPTDANGTTVHNSNF